MDVVAIHYDIIWLLRDGGLRAISLTQLNEDLSSVVTEEAAVMLSPLI